MAADVSPRQVAHWAAFAAVCLGFLGGLFWLTLPSAEPLRHGNPATTALIEARMLEARERGRAGGRNQHCVPLERITTWLISEVVYSADAHFFEQCVTDEHQS